MTYVKCSIVAC